MEIQISGGIVRRVRGGKDAPMNGLAIQARTVANFLPLLCQRARAKIVHNSDANYTGIVSTPRLVRWCWKCRWVTVLTGSFTN
ncbi:hypothetical protein AB0F96_30220 [Streptomyces sp. NPDC023998]|uniref:hypothetical protein n=1 Tax=Streptomyces sp. NPDC023998 TaxID=3154597 RepID=UPI0033D266F9